MITLMNKIPFNVPTSTSKEVPHLIEAVKSKKLSGDGPFGKKCEKWFERNLGVRSVHLTPSCTHALEMAAILIDIGPGDEVIMPSYTFVSTANAFVLRGAKIVFVDIRPDTMNIDESLIHRAITEKTKAIVPVHYAGVACEMDTIMEIASEYNLYVIEDAAQGMMSSYKGKALGSIGHLGALSFHETKNYTSGGEGGLLIVNDEKFSERAEIIREKGTNRSNFFRGMVDKYSWVDVGSSYLPSELQAAYLWPQLIDADEINKRRLASWSLYHIGLVDLQDKGLIELPFLPEATVHNAHIFFIKVKDVHQRSALIEFLRRNNIGSAFHYVPLHSTCAGQEFGRFFGEDVYTTKDSERLLRLPLWSGIKESAIDCVVKSVHEFFAN